MMSSMSTGSCLSSDPRPGPCAQKMLTSISLLAIFCSPACTFKVISQVNTSFPSSHPAPDLLPFPCSVIPENGPNRNLPNGMTLWSHTITPQPCWLCLSHPRLLSIPQLWQVYSHITVFASIPSLECSSSRSFPSWLLLIFQVSAVLLREVSPNCTRPVGSLSVTLHAISSFIFFIFLITIYLSNS